MGTSYSKSKKKSVYHIFVLHHLLEIIDAYVQLQNSIIIMYSFLNEHYLNYVSKYYIYNGRDCKLIHVYQTK